MSSVRKANPFSPEPRPWDRTIKADPAEGSSAATEPTGTDDAAPAPSTKKVQKQRAPDSKLVDTNKYSWLKAPSSKATMPGDDNGGDDISTLVASFKLTGAQYKKPAVEDVKDVEEPTDDMDLDLLYEESVASEFYDSEGPADEDLDSDDEEMFGGTGLPASGADDEEEEVPEDQEEDDDDVEIITEKNVSKHDKGIHKVIVPDKLSKEAKFTESPAEMYPASAIGHNLLPLHRRYDGQDRFQDKSLKLHDAKQAAIVVEAPFLSNDVQPIWVEHGEASGSARSGCKVSFDSSSQFANVAISIDIAGDGEPPKFATCYYFGTSVQLGSDDQGRPNEMKMEMNFGTTDSDYIARGVPEQAAFWKAAESVNQRGMLLETRLAQWRSGDVEQGSSLASYTSRPVWNGVGEEQLQKWADMLSNQDLLEKNNLTEGQLTAAMMSRGWSVQVYREMKQHEMPILPKFKEVFLGGMAASALYGTFWQYELQCRQTQEKSIDHIGANLSKLAPPRHLVKQMRVLESPDGRQTPIKAAQWTRMNPPKVFPDKRSAAFFMRLSEVRELQKRDELVVNALNNTAGDILAKFTRLPSEVDSFWVEIQIPELKSSLAKGRELWLGEMLPSEGDRFSLKLTIEGWGETLDKELTMKGTIQDSPVATDATLCGRVKASSEDIFEGVVYSVKLKLASDKKSGNRKLKAVHAIAASQDSKGRKEGVDMCALLFGARSREMRHPGKLASDIASVHGLRNHMQANLERLDNNWERVYDLNPYQMEAVRLIWDTDKGVVLVHGPPGTGKTQVIVASAEGFAMAGKVVAIVAPANSMVDNAMQGFKKQADNTKPCNSFARARNVYFSTTTVDSLDATTATAATDAAPSDFELAVNAETKTPSWTLDGDDGFGAIKAQRLKELRKADSEFKEQADRYVEILDTLRDLDSGTSKQEVKKLRAELKAIEQDVLPEICKPIRIWFVTTNSSGHANLSQHVPVDVIYVDEAGLSSMADVSVTLNGWMRTAKEVILVGDQLQQDPLCTSTERNEGEKMMQSSLFSSLMNDKDGKAHLFDEVMLRVQYRGHPDIFGPVSDNWYRTEDGRGLEHAESTKRIVPLQNTVKQYNRTKFGAAYNGRFRSAVCVEGTDAAHKQYKSTKSIFNEKEAAYAVEWCAGLLDFNPASTNDEPCVKVMPGDIGFTSPYKGQVKKFQELARSAEFRGSGVKDVSASTVAVVQGWQFPIHVISFTRSNPKDAMDTGHITDPGKLCVLVSRARYYQLQFGNFKGWLNASAGGSMLVKKHKKFYQFIDGLVASDDVITMPDWQAGVDGKPVLTRSQLPVQLPSQGQNMSARGNRGGIANAPLYTRGGHSGGYGPRGGRGGNNAPRGGRGGGNAPRGGHHGGGSNKRARHQ